MIQLTLNALVEPRRREILACICKHELTFTAIASQFDISAPAVSKHLKVLAESGLVTFRRDGTKKYYRLRKEGLSDIKVFIDQFWDDSFLRLKEAAEEEERRMRNGR
jgi:DNA-binding transcriptional ArsR family regulator